MSTGKNIESILDISKKAFVTLKEILSALGGSENADAWECGRVLVKENDKPVQLPPIPIPKGMRVVVSALPTNTSAIYTSYSKETCTDESRRRNMSKEGGIGLRVKNANMVWIIGSANNGVGWVCEKEIRNNG